MRTFGKQLLAAAILTLASIGCGHAAEITFLCAGALEPWVKELIPAFERASTDKLKPTFQAIGIITDRIRKGDAADLAVVSPQQWEDLQKEGKLDPAVRAVIAKVGYGVFARKGAVQPDVGSVEAFKRAFLNARSIAAFEPGPAGPTGPYVARLFDQLGISEQVKPKILYSRTGPAQLFEFVAKGDAELGIAQISEIITAPGIELIAPVPSEIQGFTVFTTAIPATARQPEAARTVIASLISPAARSSLAVNGLEGP